jgi:ABC-type transport system substrate-binding protein
VGGGGGALRDTVGLSAPDDRTLIVQLRQPTSYFLDLLCFGVFFPVHRPTVEGWPAEIAKQASAAGGWPHVDAPHPDDCRWLNLNRTAGKIEQKHGWARPERHVGNGPYRLAQWRYKRDMRLVRSETFRDPARAQCDSILALTIEDTNTSVLAFESGRVDWLVDVSAEYQADMIAQRTVVSERHARAAQSAGGGGRHGGCGAGAFAGARKGRAAGHPRVSHLRHGLLQLQLPAGTGGWAGKSLRRARRSGARSR